MDAAIAFAFAVMVGMASGATAGATQADRLVADDATVAPFETTAISSPAPINSETRRLMEQVNGILEQTSTEHAKRERTFVRINTRNDAGERLSIRIFRRARGACSGGRCG